jgi:lipopolysaccharide/colanic/teichoic acid biosynthesis glycosyltransferase
VGAKELEIERLARLRRGINVLEAAIHGGVSDEQVAVGVAEPETTATHAPLDERVLLQLAGLRTGLHLRLDEILAYPHFIKELQREKLRSDRSASPLCLLVYQLRGGEVAVERAVRLLVEMKRQTDTLGSIEENRLALLLPETTSEGAQQLIRKIEDRCNSSVLALQSLQTYPSPHFTDPGSAEGPTLALNYLIGKATAVEKEKYRLKRALDLIGATIGIVLLAPVMLATAIAVALSSKGPVVYRQIRVGQGGAPFVFFKFRSMYSDSDDRVHREYVAQLISGNLSACNTGNSGKPFYKMADDPRITSVGKFIRNTSLDELPQLFNVLKGDMSLVGPRPALPYEVQKYQPWHLRRLLEVKPGITGRWQVEGRSRTTFDQMVRLDLQYITNCSLREDLSILVKTVKVVLWRDGAS